MLPPAQNWTNRPMRWGQMAMVEDDPAHMDIDFWIDYFRRTKVDGVCLNAGGYTAYYPTDIEHHHRSSWLYAHPQGDPFGELVQRCREMGLIVIGRIDPHAVRQEVLEAHPEWIAVTADDQFRPHWAMDNAWVTCGLGPYNLNFMTGVIDELMARYQLDAVFANRWAGSGRCYCAYCRSHFKAEHDHDIPHDDDRNSPAFRTHKAFEESQLWQVIETWDAAIKKHNPHGFFLPNAGGDLMVKLDMRRLGQYLPLAVADRQGRNAIVPLWEAGKNAREFRAAFGDKPIMAMFSVGVEDHNRWKDSAQSAAEIRAWASGAMAQGMRPWFIKFSATLHDRRWLGVVEGMFRWHATHEAVFRDAKSIAQIGVVFSQTTQVYYGDVEPALRGMMQALIEARLPFDMVHDQLLDLERISRYKTLILPNIAALSDGQCDQIRAYVEAGGSLVATFETSLYDEIGQQREDFGLADLFSMHYRETVGPFRNAYINIAPIDDDAVLMAGFEDASRMINGKNWVELTSFIDPPPSPFTRVPAYPDLPMEEVYPREVKTNIPEVILQELDHSRVAYLPGDIDRTLWDVLHEDHARLLGNVIRWAINGPQPITVSGPGLFDLALWRGENFVALHIVNLSSPMTMRGYVRQALPIGPLQITLRLDQLACDDCTVVRALVSETALATTLGPETITATLPQLGAYDVVVFDLEG